jgi:hypothetical protein
MPWQGSGEPGTIFGGATLMTGRSISDPPDLIHLRAEVFESTGRELHIGYSGAY